VGDYLLKYFAVILAAAFAMPLVAAIQPFPDGFHTETLQTNGTSLYVRVGGPQID
jgi:hypothetical protein